MMMTMTIIIITIIIRKSLCDLHLHLEFALKCLFVYFTFVFEMHSAQVETFKASFTDKEITFFFFRLNNGCKGSCGVRDSVSSCFIYKAR